MTDFLASTGRTRPTLRTPALPRYLILAILSGCYRDTENEADVCILPGGSPLGIDDLPDGNQDFIAGDPLKVSAAFYISVDIKTRMPQCTVDVKDDLITIQTNYEWKGHSGNDALGVRHATCTSEPLPAGTYILKYGINEEPLTIPSTTPAPCLSAQ